MQKARNKYALLVILLLAFLLVRLPIVLTSMYKLYDDEELYVGTIAKELIDGPLLPVFEYPLKHTKGGTLAWGILCVPFFLLFGQSYLALKLLTLTAALAILAVSYLLLWKFFDWKAALIAGILFIFSPPLYTKFSLASYGWHFESILFTMTVIFIFYHIFFRGPEDAYTRRNPYFAALGLVSGIGIFFTYGCLIPLCVCLLFWFIFDHKFMMKKSFLIFFIFFLIGLSPWIYYTLSHHAANICLDANDPQRPLRDFILSKTPFESLCKLKYLLVRDLPNSLSFEDFKRIPGHALSGLYYIIFILSFCVLAWRNRKSMSELLSGRVSSLAGCREVFILVYFIIFCLVYSFSFFQVSPENDEYQGFYGYRFLVVAYPFIFMIIALFLSWLWSRKENKAALALLLSSVFVLIPSGIVANCGLITARNFGRPLLYEGYSYMVLGQTIGERFGNVTSRAADLAKKAPQAYRRSIFEGIGIDLGWRFPEDMRACIDRIDTIDQEYRPYAFEGIGIFLGWKYKDEMMRVAYLVDQVDKEYRQHVYRGLGAAIGFRFSYRFKKSISKISELDREYQPYCYLGLGEVTGMRFGQNIVQCVDFSKQILPYYRSYYFEGLARRLGWRYKYYAKKDPSALVEEIPAQYRNSFLKGIAELSKE
jgi:4-amino-4-deoxy-L-arabinose transferase-like glycosyltransferase